MVRSGYLTLVFAGWSLIIKTAIEKQMEFQKMAPYILIISAFSLALALSGYRIDKEYARRKFRVINSINQLTKLMLSRTYDISEYKHQDELTELLKISGDAYNKNYKSGEYNNEISIINTIYSVPSILIVIILLNYLNNLFLK